MFGGRCLLLGLASMVIANGCSQDAANKPATGKISIVQNGVIPGPARAEEQHFDRMVAGQEVDGEKAAEAREWLNPKHTANALWKTNREQTLKLVNELYSAGASGVYAVYSPADDTIRVNLCARLLIALPKDPQQRQKVIRAFNQMDKQFWGEDHEAQTDSGQHYLHLEMDS
jgi:hypothetical protein